MLLLVSIAVSITVITCFNRCLNYCYCLFQSLFGFLLSLVSIAVWITVIACFNRCLNLFQFITKHWRKIFCNFFKGEVRVQNNLSSNERLYNAYLPHKVLNLHVKSKSRNIAIKVRKYTAAAMMYIVANLRSRSGVTL